MVAQSCGLLTECTACEDPAGQPSADGSLQSFQARFLHSGLRPPVEMTKSSAPRETQARCPIAYDGACTFAARFLRYASLWDAPVGMTHRWRLLCPPHKGNRLPLSSRAHSTALRAGSTKRSREIWPRMLSCFHSELGFRRHRESAIFLSPLLPWWPDNTPEIYAICG